MAVSKNVLNSTSPSVTTAHTRTTPQFPTNAVFIRKLKADDAREIITLLELSDYDPQPHEIQLGIFNEKCQLVGMYGTLAEAFVEANDSDFDLYVVH